MWRGRRAGKARKWGNMDLSYVLPIVIPLMGLITIVVIAVTVIFPQREAKALQDAQRSAAEQRRATKQRDAAQAATSAGSDQPASSSQAASSAGLDDLQRKQTELDRRATELQETEDRYAGALTWLMQQLGLDDGVSQAPAEIAISFERRQANSDEQAEHLILKNDGSLERETWITEGIDCKRQQHPVAQLDPSLVQRLHGILGRLVNDGLLQDAEEESSEDGSVALSVTIRLGAWAFVSRTDGASATNLQPRWQELYRELDELL
jgi:Sec-independent protein translocase protein TatA